MRALSSESSPAACLGSGQVGGTNDEDLVIWGMHPPYRSSHLHCQLSHLAANSVQVYLENERLKTIEWAISMCLPHHKLHQAQSYSLCLGLEKEGVMRHYYINNIRSEEGEVPKRA